MRIFGIDQLTCQRQTRPMKSKLQCYMYFIYGTGFIRYCSVDGRFRAVDYKIEVLQHQMQAMAARLRELERASQTQTQTHGHGQSHHETNKTLSQSSQTPAAASTSSSAGALNRILNAPKSPTYIGPTSAEFGLGSRQNDAHEGDEEESKSPSPADTGLPTGDLGELGLDEALRLLSIYEQSVGIMYPCVDLDSVRTYIMDFFQSGGNGMTPATAVDQDWFFARDVTVVKMILATALLAESHGRSERAAQFADSVEDEFAGRVKIAEVDMKELLILTLLVNDALAKKCYPRDVGSSLIADGMHLTVHFPLLPRRRSNRLATNWHGRPRLYATGPTPPGNLDAHRRRLPR